MNLISRIRQWWNRRSAPKDEPVVCTYCGGTQWYEGPTGGISTNIMCANPECGHWFNWHRGYIPMDDLHRTGWR